MACKQSQKRKSPMSDMDIALEDKVAEKVKRAYKEGFATGKREEKSHYKGVLPLYREHWQARLQLEECRKILARREAELRLLTKLIAAERVGQPLALETVRTRIERKLKAISEEVEKVTVPGMNWDKLRIDYM